MKIIIKEQHDLRLYLFCFMYPCVPLSNSDYSILLSTLSLGGILDYLHGDIYRVKVTCDTVTWGRPGVPLIKSDCRIL